MTGKVSVGDMILSDFQTRISLWLPHGFKENRSKGKDTGF
jgi:hypothetical protein